MPLTFWGVAVRLNYNGVKWENFDTPVAQEKIALFLPILRRWRERTGGR